MELNGTVKVRKEKKLPLFVTVYGTIYDRIAGGTYQPGSQLPSESDLAEELNVSRGTLRQALLLLQEDGMIINHQGKGNFVMERGLPFEPGVERLNNALIDYSNVKIDRVKTDIQFQVATDKHREQFKLEPSALISLIEVIYYSGQSPTGLAQIFIPYDILVENQVVLSADQAVYEFYNRFICQENLVSDSKIRIAYARKSTAGMLQTKEGVPMIMMEEKIYQAGRQVIFQKNFMLPDYYELTLQRYHDNILGGRYAAAHNPINEQ